MRLILHNWHRRIGITAALFVLVLSVTGIVLNHTERFRLDEIYINNELILDWYEIHPDSAPVSFAVDGNRITRIGRRLYFNEIELNESSGALYGAVSRGEMIIAALEGELLLLTRNGDIVETLSGSEGVPSGLRNIGTDRDGDLIVKGAHGDYRVDINTLEWREREVNEIVWVESSEPPANLYADLLKQYRGKGLTLERILMDLHSGRILGRFGVYIVDAAAILFVLLALSGVWMWTGRR